MHRLRPTLLSLVAAMLAHVSACLSMDVTPKASNDSVVEAENASEPPAKNCLTMPLSVDDDDRLVDESLPSECRCSSTCDLWYISCRNLPYCPTTCIAASSQPGYFRYCCGRWVSSSADDFFSTLDPDTVLGMFVHGNNKQSSDAKQRGMEIHSMLCCRNQNQHFRLVVWSWPSQKTPLQPLSDVRAKAARSVAQSLYLGTWLAKIDPNMRISIMCSSFGARVATGALHLLSGGTVNGQGISACETRRPIRLFMIQPAFPCEWILRDGKFGRSTRLVADLFLAYNSRDFVLKRYRRTIQDGIGDALGYTGLPSRNKMDTLPNATFRQWDATHLVKRSHDYNRYKSLPYFQHKAAQYMLWQPIASGTSSHVRTKGMVKTES